MNRLLVAGAAVPALLGAAATAPAASLACQSAGCAVRLAQAAPASGDQTGAPSDSAGPAVPAQPPVAAQPALPAQPSLPSQPSLPAAPLTPVPAPQAVLPQAPADQPPAPQPPAPQSPAPQAPPSPPATASPGPGQAPNGTVAPRLGTLRNGTTGTLGGIDPQYYGGTQSSPGRPQGGLQPAYGSTQRNTGLSDDDNAHPLLGASPYGGTQSTLGTPQFSNTPLYGTTSPGVNTPAQTRSLTGTTLPGNTANNTRAPLGGAPLTRDQIGNYGGRAGYNAQGVYTGVAGQSVGYGQPYASSGRPVGGLLSTGVDATGPLRPYIPLDAGRASGPTNSGYGIPNGSRATTMDARGIQRIR